MLKRYERGKASVAFGNNQVTGSGGTSWLTYVKPGWVLTCGGYSAEVLSVESATSLTLATTWAGDTLNQASYHADWVETKAEWLATIIGNIDAIKDRLKMANFPYAGHNWYADYDAIAGTCNICNSLPDTDPIPTPSPITGYWMSADTDSNGNPVVLPFTVAEFKDFARAYYARDATLWATARVHKNAVESIAKDPESTVDDVKGYNYLTGW